ncbi:Neuroguidin [Smittium mucronatum]|uniref:Neuroguidin n=1 Tax=Smittium mucronatum TaxID=133383 RepID=A0A1R0H6I3_9FUNG|nr:Neuroguidin [Smittium mucronatum]
MKYQIDKLIKTALTSQAPKTQIAPEKSLSLDDPLVQSSELQDNDDAESLYKPKIDSLMASAKTQGMLVESTLPTSSTYQPPKLIPVHYEEDDSLKAKREKAELRLKERSKKSQIIKELVSEFDSRPEQSSSWGTSYSIGVAQNERLEAARKEREKYEEDNFIRMTISKKDKKKLAQGTMRLDDEFAGLEDFAGIETLSKANASSVAKRKNVYENKANNPHDSSTFSKPSSKKIKQGKFQARKRK